MPNTFAPTGATFKEKSFKYGLPALGCWKAFGGVGACAGRFVLRGSIPRLGTWAASRGSNNRVNLTVILAAAPSEV